MTGPRDERLGAALRELYVPDHGPDFWSRLEAELEREADRSGARPPKRWPRERRPLRLGAGNRRLRLGVAVAATAAVAAALLIGLPRGESPTPALADVVKARVQAAVAQLRTLEGTAFLRTRQPAIVARTHAQPRTDRQHLRFVLAADGSFMVSETGAAVGGRATETRGPRSAYDAEAGVERAVTTSASLGGLGRFYVERRGLAPGPPDETAEPLVVDHQLAAAVQALLAADDPRIEAVTFRGRPAWEATFTRSLEPVIEATERIEVTVDQETGLPVHVRRTTDPSRWGASVLRITGLRVNRPLPAGALEPAFPPGAEVSRSDAGFRRMGLDRLEEIAGYRPLVAADLPDGFELAQVAVASRAAPTGGGRNPRSRAVVSLAYRRGFEQVTVTTRLAGADPASWRDPFAIPGVPETRERLELAAGALAGAQGEVAVGPFSMPHLWAVGDGLVLTVAGDLAREDLVRVAESMRAAPSA
jgi:hypothetical protein